MGKRKTKTGKAKQAKATTRLAKQFAKKVEISKEKKKEKKPFAQKPKQQAKKKKTPQRDEEFERERQSMVERITWKRNTGPAKKMDLHPARFAATDKEKSTSQLVNETMQQISTLGTAPSLQQPVHAVNTLSTSSLWANPALLPVADSSNPWAVLDDDDDDDQNEVKVAPPPTMFQFAAPTFQYGAPAFSLNNDMLDPDL
jgi:hypothetical protein